LRYNIWTLKDYTLPDFSGYSSSNTYRVEAATFSDALSYANDLATWEIAILGNNVILDRVRIRDDSQGPGDGYYSGSYGPGARSYGFGELGIVQWALMVSLFSGPRLIGRKWLRLGLMPREVSNGEVDPTLVALVRSAYADPLAAAGVYRTRGDVVIDGAQVDPRLRLYGLRHGTRRRELLYI
jgi:hypothetical protein